MIRSLTFALPALAAGGLLLAGCDRQSGGEAQPGAAESGAAAGAGAAAVQGKQIDRSHKGAALPELVFKDPGGKELRLSALKGKPLLVNLWATWCAPCVAELPTLDKLAGAKAGSLKVLTVSEDLEGPDKVAAFLKEKGIANLEPWLDPQNEATVQYGVSTLPTTILYDAQGREVWRLSGGHDWGSAETAALLKEGGVE